MKRILFAAFLFLISCSSAQTIKDVRFTLSQINRAIEGSLNMGVDRREDNGRTYISNYFKLAPDNKDERGLAKIYVLGLEQPYKIEVEVEIEKRGEAGQWSFDGFDKDLAGKLRDKIQDYLYNRERNKNLIDDFRPF